MKSLINYINENISSLNKDIQIELTENDEAINKEYKDFFDNVNIKEYDRLDVQKCIEDEYSLKKGDKLILLDVRSGGWSNSLGFEIAIIKYDDLKCKEISHREGYTSYNVTLYGEVLTNITKYSNSRLNDDYTVFNYKDAQVSNSGMIYVDGDLSNEYYYIIVNPKYNDMLLNELEKTGKILFDRFFKFEYSENLDDYIKNHHKYVNPEHKWATFYKEVKKEDILKLKEKIN